MTTKLARVVSAFCCVAVFVTGATDGGGEESRRIEPELAPDVAVLKTLNSLNDGESAMLPAFQVTGDLNAEAKRWNLDKNGPGARDYCIKMCWMPDRRRAIFYGANHGAPHRLNDVWEYDLPSNTWVCLYGPDRSKQNEAEAWEDVDWDNIAEGVIRTKRGGPAIIPHSWWNMTYDPRLKAMITPCSWSMSHPKLFQLLKQGKHQPPLWAFYPETRRWEPILDSKGPLPSYENARAMEFVPELGGVAWTKSDGMWLFDGKENKWSRLGTSQDYGDNLPPREQVMAYLADRNLLVAHTRAGEGKPSVGYPESKTFHYAIDKNKWKMVHHSTEKNNPPPGFDAMTNFVYDPVGKVCLLWDAVYTNALWAYDPAMVQWRRLTPQGPPPPHEHRDTKLAYYDAAHNVFVLPGRWVYRHKRRNATQPK